MPAISVLMPAFNAGSYLKEAVESVLNQSFPDFELIIVDDGSTDQSFDTLIGIKDRRIRIIRNEVNLGLIASRNVALSNAKAPLIACLDADDIALPNRLEKQMNVFNGDPDLALLGCRADLIDEKGRKFGVVDVPTASDDIRRTIFRHNNIIHSSVMMRKDVINQLGGYSRDYPVAEDYALWLRLMLHHKALNLPERLVQYRVHKLQVSQKKIQLMCHTVRKIQNRSWEELLSKSTPGFVLPPFSPSLWNDLKGGDGTIGQHCIFWSRLYKQMGNGDVATRIVMRGLLSAPFCLSLYAELLPREILAVCKRVLRRIRSPR